VGVLSSLRQFNGSVLKAVGKPSWRLGIGVLDTVATSLAILAVVRSGITAVALASAAVGLLLYPVGFLLVRRLIGVQPGRYAAQFAGPLVAALLCAAAALGVRALAEPLAQPLRIALAVGAGAAAYGIGLRLAAPALMRRCFELVGDAWPARLRPRAPEV
jgi:PST family polysaccharide transporter